MRVGRTMITGADGQRLKMLGAFAGRDYMPFEFLGFYTGDLLEFEDGEGPRRTEDWSREIQNTVTGDSPPITRYTHILSHWLTYTLQIHYPPPPFSYLIHIHPLPGCLPPTQGETTNRLHISFEFCLPWAAGPPAPSSCPAARPPRRRPAGAQHRPILP